MSGTVICPGCKGTGKNAGYACPGFVYREWPCDLCDGTGRLGAERLAWPEEGRRRRADRLDRNLSGREEARRLGVGFVELSQAEHGLIDPREVWP